MGRWASLGRTEASLTLPPPVRPLLTGLRQAEAGLGIKQSSGGVNFSFVCFFLNIFNFDPCIVFRTGLTFSTYC